MENRDREFEKIEPTALLIAHLRRFTDIKFAEEIAMATGAEEASRKFFEGKGVKLEDTLKNAVFAEARYKCILSAIVRLNLKQIIEFGSGISFRSLSLPADPEIIYVETDLPGIIGEKSGLIDKISAMKSEIGRRKIFFHPANILSEKDIDAALVHFDDARQVGIVCEGLLGYLTLGEKKVAAQNVRRILERFGGTWITPDITTRARLEAHAKRDGQAPAVNAAVASSTQRDFSENAFDDEDHAVEFFADLGLSARAWPQIDGSFSLTSIERLELDNEFIRQFQADMKVWSFVVAPTRPPS